MLRLQISKEEVEQLRYERFHHPHPRVQRRMEALPKELIDEADQRTTFVVTRAKYGKQRSGAIR